MSEISRTALFGKLNPVAYRAIESATLFCKMRGNPYVELVHWLVQIVQTPNTDLDAILRHYQVDASALAKELPREAAEALVEDALDEAGRVRIAHLHQRPQLVGLRLSGARQRRDVVRH